MQNTLFLKSLFSFSETRRNFPVLQEMCKRKFCNFRQLGVQLFSVSDTEEKHENPAHYFKSKLKMRYCCLSKCAVS